MVSQNIHFLLPDRFLRFLLHQTCPDKTDDFPLFQSAPHTLRRKTVRIQAIPLMSHTYQSLLPDILLYEAWPARLLSEKQLFLFLLPSLPDQQDQHLSLASLLTENAQHSFRLMRHMPENPDSLLPPALVHADDRYDFHRFLYAQAQNKVRPSYLLLLQSSP